MKVVGAYLFTAVVLALIGVLCLGAGRLDRDMAHGQQSLSALKYDEADKAFASAERYFDYASSLPGVGKASINDIHTRRAALRYWQRQYGAVSSLQPDPENIDLQEVVANALYRSGRLDAKDRPKTLQAVDASIQAYVGVLKSARRQEDAAYNYEYLVRLRDELALGRGSFKLPPGFGDPNGSTGSPMEPGDAGKFNIYVPLEKDERDKAGGAGKAAPIKRKG